MKPVLLIDDCGIITDKMWKEIENSVALNPGKMHMIGTETRINDMSSILARQLTETEQTVSEQMARERLKKSPFEFYKKWLDEQMQYRESKALLLCYAQALVKRPKMKLRGWKNKERAWGRK